MQQFEIVFNVPMHCQACVESVAKVLRPLTGVSAFDIDLKNQIVSTTTSLPPSELVHIIQSTGRDAIIRGTGKPNSAAVCILESYAPEDFDQPVKGLARIVAATPNELFIDLTVNGLPKGTYYPSIRRSGNLSDGALSTGDLFYALGSIQVKNDSTDATTIKSIGAATPSPTEKLGSGQAFLHAKLGVMDLIGRSIVLSKLQEKVAPDSICGVIARSAGAWENDKLVCSCSGKTVWEERKDAVIRGVA